MKRFRRTDRKYNRLTVTRPEMDRLVLDHLPLIKTLARRLSHLLPPNVETCDLVSAGIIGFMNAIEKYDPSRGAKLRTFAEFRIRGAMLDCLRGLDWAPRSLRQQSKKLRQACETLAQRLGREPAPEELCEEMKIGLDEMHQIERHAHTVNLTSLECRDARGDRREKACQIDSSISSPGSTPSHAYAISERRDILARAIDSLPRTQRLVISLRYYDELGTLDIARVLQVNASRVSQLHTKAISALRARLARIDAAA